METKELEEAANVTVACMVINLFCFAWAIAALVGFKSDPSAGRTFVHSWFACGMIFWSSGLMKRMFTTVVVRADRVSN